MNINWTEINGQGNYDEGFIDIFLKNDDKRAIVIISFLTQHTDHSPRIVITVLLEGNIGDWTKGVISSIYQDAEDYIKNVINTKFRYIDIIDNVQRQIFTLKNIDDFKYVSHGDYNFITE